MQNDEIASTIDCLISKTFTVQEAFGIPSQIKLNGFTAGHPLVPQKTEGYVWDTKLLKDAIEWISEDNPDPLYISGETGCGKTVFLLNLFGSLNIPTIVVSANASTEIGDLLGRIHLRNGNTEFVPGDLIKAYEKGYAIVFDEIDFYNPEVMPGCNRLLERGVVTLDNGSIVRPASKCLMAATANTRGDGQGNDVYTATNIFNLATMSRFERWTMPYPPQSVEIQIMKNKFSASLDDAVITAMVKTAADVRLAYQQGNCPCPMSIRDLLRFGRKLIAAWNRKDVSPIYHAFDKAIANGLDVHVKEMLHTLVQSNFGIARPIEGV
jgi:cobaltochelatase CobS